MLARGALCRLAARGPSTSTHDLPRISQLLRTSLLAREGAPQPTVGAIARAFRATILESRRAYATKSATEPTPRVKREVKKAVAKKTVAKKAPAKKKKKAPVQKKKAAPKKPKKVQTAEEKEAQKIKDLKKKALLRGAPKRPRASAWTVFVGEALKNSKNIADSQILMKEAAAKYKNLTPAEREHYNQLSRQLNESMAVQYKKWIEQHTPEQIASANRARAALKRKLGSKHRANIFTLIDERYDTTAKKNPYILFAQERLTSGDFQGIVLTERVKLVGAEWKALSASEKKVYQDQYEAAKAAAAA